MAQIGARLEPEPGDLTPVVGSATTLAPWDAPPPSHTTSETADEDVDVAAWDQVAAMEEFRAAGGRQSALHRAGDHLLHRLLFRAAGARWATRRASWTPRSSAPVNIAYLFALSQFFMAWILACALPARRRAGSTRWRKNIIAKLNTQAGREVSHVDPPDHVPRLHRHHARHHLLGGAAHQRQPAPSSPPTARSPAGRTASPWRATT